MIKILKSNKKIKYHIIRLHLEYAAPAWSPYRKKDILTLQRVQRRSTKLVTKFKNLSYEERLVKLIPTTLEKRRNRGDLIVFFKFYSYINIINSYMEPLINRNSRPRRYSNQHSLIRPPPATCPQKENFLTYIVLKSWNSLLQEIIQTSSKIYWTTTIVRKSQLRIKPYG